MRSALAMVAVSFSLGLLPACSDSSETSADPTSSVDVTEPRAATSTTSQETSPSVVFKTDEGWSYSFTPNVGDIRVQFSKKISSSPPGKARLEITIASSASGFPGSVVSMDRGRNAPGVQVRGSTAYWPLADTAKAALFKDGSAYAAKWFPNGCLPWTNEGSGPVSGPVFLCHLRGSTYTSSEAPESEVDAFLALAVAQGQPFVSVGLYSADDHSAIPSPVASILIAPDGTATL